VLDPVGERRRELDDPPDDRISAGTNTISSSRVV